MVHYVAGSAMLECGEFNAEMLAFVWLLFVVFLIYTMKATFFHWEMGATGVGSITGVKAIFLPFFC